MDVARLASLLSDALATTEMVEFPSTMFARTSVPGAADTKKGLPDDSPLPHSSGRAANSRSLIIGSDRERAGVDSVGSGRRQSYRSADPEDHAGRRPGGAEVDGRGCIRRERQRSRTGQVEPWAADCDDRIVGANELVPRGRRSPRAGHVAATARQDSRLIHTDNLARPGAGACEHEIAKVEVLLELDGQRLEDPSRRRRLGGGADRRRGNAVQGERRRHADGLEEIPHVRSPLYLAPSGRYREHAINQKRLRLRSSLWLT